MFIGEVSRRTGVSVRMLRHYESLDLLIPHGRTTGGYREFGEKDLRRILHIESLRSLGLSLREVRSALEDPDFAPEHLVAELIERSRERLQRERELLRRLRAVAASGPADWEDVLRVVHLLQGLRSPDPLDRQRAGLASIAAGLSPARALARAALEEGDPNVAGTLRWAVLQVGGEAVDAVTRGLGSGAAEVRARAVRILSESADPRHRSVLPQALTDDDAGVRGLTALALGRWGDPRAVPVLLGMVRTGDRDVAAAEALGVITGQDPTATARILDGLRKALNPGESTEAERLRLTQALAEIPGPETRALLRELVDSRDRPVQLTATAILAQRS